MKKTKNSELKSGLVEEEDVVRATLKKISRFKNRGQYRIVESDSQNIMPSSTETRTED